MTEPALSEHRIREIAKTSAREVLDSFFERLGIDGPDDVKATRRNLEYLAELRAAQESRRTETKKTAFHVIGGVILFLFGLLASAVGLKGHIP